MQQLYYYYYYCCYYQKQLQYFYSLILTIYCIVRPCVGMYVLLLLLSVGLLRFLALDSGTF